MSSSNSGSNSGSNSNLYSELKELKELESSEETQLQDQPQDQLQPNIIPRIPKIQFVDLKLGSNLERVVVGSVCATFGIVMIFGLFGSIRVWECGSLKVIKFRLF